MLFINQFAYWLISKYCIVLSSICTRCACCYSSNRNSCIGIGSGITRYALFCTIISVCLTVCLQCYILIIIEINLIRSGTDDMRLGCIVCSYMRISRNIRCIFCNLGSPGTCLCSRILYLLRCAIQKVIYRVGLLLRCPVCRKLYILFRHYKTIVCMICLASIFGISPACKVITCLCRFCGYNDYRRTHILKPFCLSASPGTAIQIIIYIISSYILCIEIYIMICDGIRKCNSLT